MDGSITNIVESLPLSEDHSEPSARPSDDATHARRIDWHYPVIKRVVDFGAAIVLGIPFLLLLPFLALAIYLDSPGPTFYSQMRVGRNGNHFRIYKLRSMAIDAERHGAVWAQSADPRVTRVGRWLRKTRVDEFPQLLNIIRGEMTLVGPRPERPEFTAELELALDGYHERHVVTPGLTGWAQVNYSYTNSIDGSRIKLDYDLWYVRHAGPKVDVIILWRTARVMLGRKGW